MTVLTRGRGKQGYCRLCSWSEEPALNRLMKSGKNAAECNRWATDKFGFSFNRQTFYRHKEHITAPEDKLVTAADRARSNKPVIRTASNQQFLEAVRDLGYTRAIENPDEVSVDHALKAAAILEQSKSKRTDITLIFAQAVTGHQPDVVVIEGTAREVDPTTYPEQRANSGTEP